MKPANLSKLSPIEIMPRVKLKDKGIINLVLDEDHAVKGEDQEQGQHQQVSAVKLKQRSAMS